MATPEPLILASSSPRRSSLLAEYGYKFEVFPADVEELSDPSLSPEVLVLHNAKIKARAVALQNPERTVLGADTVVALEGRVFGKPANMEDAARMLEELNGREHAVFSGVCLVRYSTATERAFVETTKVRFKNLSQTQRLAYLQRIGPLDKAGAYAAQDDQGEIIASVEGSFTNVIGLPMEALQNALELWDPKV